MMTVRISCPLHSTIALEYHRPLANATTPSPPHTMVSDTEDSPWTVPNFFPHLSILTNFAIVFPSLRDKDLTETDAFWSKTTIA